MRGRNDGRRGVADAHVGVGWAFCGSVMGVVVGRDGSV